MSIVTYSLSDYDALEMRSPRLIRFRLNSAGFKFEDDHLTSSAINDSPIPLGLMEVWRDEETKTTHYKQICQQ